MDVPPATTSPSGLTRGFRISAYRQSPGQASGIDGGDAAAKNASGDLPAKKAVYALHGSYSENKVV
ncbi:hypothetical protein G6M17_20155 [Agrobacterium tumefaciens]|uniref:hypothetical protein n=1 Tax=Rhizobium/Agrobacterium group TaxID=227290 RepID=UPI0007E23654|nr:MULTISPECIES: hypothetical protein [Rhizobium/Agrobacterium group]AQS64148.1 hypothetical protein B0909_17705 [Rhizobium rhizogenes]MCZ7445143.1 hypothetical protein [Rhizobium rhizogenes]NSZ81485.1 hypothetical protein [Agrobacterium tumefaciens]OAM63400.1 hypothetical protein A8L48_07550 [Rhizobium rhizogenes]